MGPAEGDPKQHYARRVSGVSSTCRGTFASMRGITQHTHAPIYRRSPLQLPLHLPVSYTRGIVLAYCTPALREQQY